MRWSRVLVAGNVWEQVLKITFEFWAIWGFGRPPIWTIQSEVSDHINNIQKHSACKYKKHIIHEKLKNKTNNYKI